MKKILLIPAILLTLNLSAQTEEVESGPVTIQSTFDAMLGKSNRYQDFKVVKQRYLTDFIAEVQDSLDLMKKEYNAEVRSKKSLMTQVENLNDTISAKEARVADLIHQRDSISTAGMNMDKNSFSTVMWLALISLLILLAVLLMRNKSLASSQKSVKFNLSDIEQELATVKKKALEREQELKREVQDYVNKIEAMGPPR